MPTSSTTCESHLGGESHVGLAGMGHPIPRLWHLGPGVAVVGIALSQLAPHRFRRRQLLDTIDAPQLEAILFDE